MFSVRKLKTVAKVQVIGHVKREGERKKKSLPPLRHLERKIWKL